jgi:trk system potassium uptake protein TrkH
VGFILGSVLSILGVAMSSAIVVSVINSEIRTALWLSVASGITVTSGLSLRFLSGKPSSITIKEGFATVGLAWFVLALFGALPYLMTGAIPSFTNAVFESTSGFTTTGFSTITDPSVLPAGVLYWRGLTNWLGGLGVVMLGVIVLPRLGTGGFQLAQAETAGPTLERLAPRFQGTARRLLIVYLVITALAIGLLWAGDMTGFEAVLHAFATVATGGFSTESTSLAAFSNYSQWVVALFMFLSAISFALHFRAFSAPGRYLRNPEFRLYVIVLVAAVLIVIGGLWQDYEPADAMRLGAFNTISIVTTTGFTSADIGQWRPALQIVLIGLMFVGGMTGSTAGAIKTLRIGVLGKAAFADVRRVVRPRAVFVTKFGRETIPAPVVEAVQSFFLFYMLIFMASTFLLAFIDANVAEVIDVPTAANAIISALGNVGPGLVPATQSGGLAGFPDPAMWLLSGLMIVGRLEIFPVLVLFTKDLWRR